MYTEYPVGAEKNKYPDECWGRISAAWPDIEYMKICFILYEMKNRQTKSRENKVFVKILVSNQIFDNSDFHMGRISAQYDIWSFPNG